MTNTTYVEALPLFIRIAVLKKWGIDGRSGDDRYAEAFGGIHKLIGSPSKCGDSKYSHTTTLGELMKFVEWAYAQLGYVYHNDGSHWHWKKPESRARRRRRLKLEVAQELAYEQLPHWCHTPMEISEKTSKILARRL